jgi:hypothetical protein
MIRAMVVLLGSQQTAISHEAFFLPPRHQKHEDSRRGNVDFVLFLVSLSLCGYFLLPHEKLLVNKMIRLVEARF